MVCQVAIISVASSCPCSLTKLPNIGASKTKRETIVFYIGFPDNTLDPECFYPEQNKYMARLEISLSIPTPQTMNRLW